MKIGFGRGDITPRGGKDKVARKSLEKLMQSYEKIAEAQQEMLP